MPFSSAARICRPTNSTLTGESVPVRKVAWDDRPRSGPQHPGGDDLPHIFSGSLVVRGSGLAEVTAIGAQSEIGKIGQSLATLETEPPRLQVQTRRVVRLFAVLGGGVSVLAVLLYGIMRGGWLDAVLAGIALGMSMLPEEFPVVLTVFMAMGAWRISLARVLTRRAAAIETLGSATVLCTDKTGTLTENRMTIVELRLTDGNVFHPQNGMEMPAQFQDLSEFGLLASAPEPFDPMERAFHSLARERLTEASYRHPHWKLVHAYGLRPDLLAVTHIWQADGDGAEYIVATKGAPEAIAGLCRLSAADRAGADAIHRRDGLRRPARAGRCARQPCRAALAGVAARTWLRIPRTCRPRRSACAPASSRRSANAGPPASRPS